MRPSHRSTGQRDGGQKAPTTRVLVEWTSWSSITRSPQSRLTVMRNKDSGNAEFRSRAARTGDAAGATRPPAASTVRPIEIETPLGPTDGHRARQPAADRAGTAGRARNGRGRVQPAARVADGFCRPRPQRADPRARGLHGLVARVARRTSGASCSTRCWPPAARCCTASSCWSSRGASDITVVCVLVAPEGVARLETSGLPIRLVTASIDEGLNENAYIVPGLGDAGDRQFGPR